MFLLMLKVTVQPTIMIRTVNQLSATTRWVVRSNTVTIPAGRLKTLVNENGDSYTFEYDERDRLIREIGFDGKMTRYTYNPASELIREEEYASENIDMRTRPATDDHLPP